jgi:coenzyme F420-reducing hydrogenase gamma subunit
MSCTVSLSELGDLYHEIVTEMMISGSMQGVEHFRDDDLDVVLIGHLE